MPRSFPRRYHTPAEPEKPFEALAEQAQQARTQFFVYLATVTFLLVTVLSITDKQLLLDNSLVTLPLINVSVPPKYVLILGPILLLITFCNLHIHWFRYVAEVKTLGLTPQAEQRKLFPFMIYQALCHRQEGFVGILESDLARLALFGLLVPVQVCFFWQLLKFHEIDFFVAFGSIIMCFSLCLTIWAITKITLPRQIIFILITLYLALIGTWVSSGQFLPQLTVTQEILSPPRELLNTPIVTPFLEKLNKEELAGTERSQQQRSTDKTKTPAPETHDVFDGVYWLDLRGKSLAWANLSGSLLLKANLMGVDLQNSELKRTDLRYANLSNTYLKEVNFKDAKLSNTNLTRVYFQKDKPKSKYGDSYSNWIPVYKVGGENLCQAKTLAYAQMDDWLFKKLKTIKACNGKLKGVNTLPPTEES